MMLRPGAWMVDDPAWRSRLAAADAAFYASFDKAKAIPMLSEKVAAIREARMALTAEYEAARAWVAGGCQ